MARYVKFDKIEPLPTDGVLDDITKSLQNWVWEAYKKGIKEQIVANTILIDKHFAKTNRIIVGNCDIPPMICGLEIKVTEELPDGYSFALVETPKTERESIIEKAKTEVAREIFEDIYKAVASKIPMKIRPIFKDDRDFDAGVIDGKRDALIEVLSLIAELEKKHTEDNNDG